MRKIKRKIKVAAAWSGGKDGCFACFKAMQEGYEVKYLVNLLRKDVHFNGKPYKDFVKLQSRAVGIPVIQREIRSSHTGNIRIFENNIKDLVLEMKRDGVEGWVFGYVLPGRQRELMKKLCDKFGLELFEPFYMKNDDDIMKDFLKADFKALILEVEHHVIDKSWLGSIIDKDFIKYLRGRLNVINRKTYNLVGDGGIYQSLALDGPIFKKSLATDFKDYSLDENFTWLNLGKFSLLDKK